MAILSDTSLETADYDMPGWVHVYNANVDRLNAVLLKLSGLVDVDLAAMRDNSLLVWRSGPAKWVARRFK